MSGTLIIQGCKGVRVQEGKGVFSALLNFSRVRDRGEYPLLPYTLALLDILKIHLVIILKGW